MSPFPRTDVEGLSLSRMIIGTNWFFGWSHTSRAKDVQIKSTMTTDKIASVIEVFLDAGVDTMMGQVQHPFSGAKLDGLGGAGGCAGGLLSFCQPVYA